MIDTLNELFSSLDKEDKIRVVQLVVLSFLASIAELISIGSIFPLISLVISPEKILSVSLLVDIFNILNINDGLAKVFCILSFYIFIVIAAGLIRLLQVFVQAKFCHHIGAKLSNDIFYNSLTQKYIYFAGGASNTLVNVIMIKINSLVFDVLIPLFNLLSAYMMFICIVCALLFVEFKVTLCVFSSFAILFMLLYSSSKSMVRKDSVTISEGLDTLQSTLNDSNGSFVDIKINNLYKYFINLFSTVDSSVRNARARVQLLIALPRIGIESLGVVLIAVFLFFGFDNREDLINAMPLIAFFALSLQKLLPLSNSIYSSSSLILSNYKSIEDILKYRDNFENEILCDKNISEFANTKWNKITLRNIQYKFNGVDDILSDLSLTITKGSKIGIVGSSGSGKTTLLNLILALIQPKSGYYEVDGLSIWPSRYLSWRNEFSYVSQNIYLAASSIASNITMGSELYEVDNERLMKVCEVALINEFAGNLPYGINTQVGERGNLLSGGQRQRIAIARALYKKSSVLVLDEATSALDNETEDKIIDNISNFDQNLTIIMVAHRTNSLKNCEYIYNLKNKILSQVK